MFFLYNYPRHCICGFNRYVCVAHMFVYVCVFLKTQISQDLRCIRVVYFYFCYYLMCSINDPFVACIL